MKKKSLVLALVLSVTLAGYSSVGAADYTSLQQAVSDTTTPRAYTLNGDETLTGDLGTMGGTGSTLTIDAASADYSIIGKNGSSQYSGITVKSGQTLVLKNIGKATISDTDYSISDVAGIQNLKQAITNNGTLTIENVVFNNSVSGTSGAIVNNANATITKITGKFLNSGNKNNPPVISNISGTSTIDYISADFINNKGKQGGAINSMKGGTINLIENSRFILNEADRAAGAIRNGETGTSSAGTINIKSSEFKYNYSRAEGGAIVNDYHDSASDKGSVLTIEGSLFENNFNVADKTGYGGGAIYHNGKLLKLTDTNFKNNVTRGDGGALLLDSLTYVNADNSNVLFSGNKSKVDSISNFNGINTTYTDGVNTSYNDIYLRKGNLYLNAKNGKSITFDGSVVSNLTNDNALFINSDSNIKGGLYNFNNNVNLKNLDISNNADLKFGSAVQADGTTSYGVLATQNFTNDSNGGTIDVVNSHIDDNTLGNIYLSSILNAKIDIDYTNGKSDTFKITGGNAGTINIDGVNFLDADLSSSALNQEKIIKILDDSGDKVDLTISTGTVSGVIGTREFEYLDIKPAATWGEKFDNILAEQEVEGELSLYNSHGTKNDSLKVEVTGYGDITEKGRSASDRDTLAVLNQYETTGDRTFTANTSNPNYTATENLGETTAGTLTVTGVDGSVLNLGSYTGFELNNVSTLNLDSLEIRGNNPAITVSNADAKVNLNNVTVNSEITGSTTFDMSTTGENTINAAISNANITNTGNLSVTKDNAFNGVSLQSSAGSLDLQTGAIETQNFKNVKLTGDVNFAIDADLLAHTSDNISADSFEGDGYFFNIDKIDILTDSNIQIVKTLVANDVLKAHVKLASSVDITKPSTTSYTITYDNTDGYLTFNNVVANFVSTARDSASSRLYNMQSDVDIANDIARIGDSSTSIGTMGGNSGAVFNVSGNNHYSIIGGGNGGIIINSGRTMNIDNVGSLNADDTVKAAWTGFKGTLFTVNSDGVLNFSGENVISGNSSNDTKNIITNTAGQINFSDGATLNLIDNTYKASLLYNTNGNIGNLNGIIKGNTLNQGTGNSQGLIYTHSDAGKNAKIDKISGTITENTLNGSSIYGGMIFNTSKGISSEIGDIDADITYNSVTATGTLFGGLIRNEADGGNVKMGDISGAIEHNDITIKDSVYGILISNKGNNGGNAEMGDISGNISYNTLDTTASGNNSVTTGFISNEGNSNGSAKIAAISGDIFNNEISANNRLVQGGLIYNYSKTYDSEIGNISGDILNNTVNSNGVHGGIIANITDNGRDAVLGVISGDISGNIINSTGNNAVQGGLVYNYSKSTAQAKISGISGNITDNEISAKSDVNGGLIYNTGTNSVIDLISGDIKNNYVESANNKIINGGILFNDTNAVSTLSSAIENNYSKASKLSGSNGGIINNAGTLTIKDSSVKDNATNLSDTVFNKGILNVIADNANVLFDGNKANATVTRDEDTGAVTVSGGNAVDVRNTQNGVLNLQAKTGKTVTFNGEITDSNNSGTINVGGTYDDSGATKNYDGDVIFNNTITQNKLNINNGGNVKLGVNGSQYGLLNLANITNDSNGGLIDSSNSHFETHTLGKANLGSALNIAIDMNVSPDLSTEADAFLFTLNNAGSGTFHIKNLNLTGGDDFKALEETKEVTQQILFNANSNVKLTLDDSVKNAFDSDYSETTHHTYTITDNTVAYDDVLREYDHLYEKSTEMSIVGSSAGLLDSIKLSVTVNNEDLNIKIHDNLKAINIANGDERTFDFKGTTNTYTSIEDAGKTATGTLTVNGTKSGDDYSTINADGHSLFDMTNYDANVVIKNTKITGATTVANVGANSELNLNNAIIDGGSITNAGIISLNNTNSISANVSGVGKVTVSDGVTTLESGSSMTQNVLDIDSAGKFINKGTLTAKLNNSATIQNDSNMTAKDGSANYNDIVGDGTLILDGQLTNEGHIAQNVVFSNGSTLKAIAGSTYSLGSVTNDANGGIFDTKNSEYSENKFGKVSLNSVLNVAMDLNITDIYNPVSDTITLISDENNSGTFNISGLNIVGADTFRTIPYTASVFAKVINNANSNTILTIDNAVKSQYDIPIADTTETGTDEFSGTSITFNDKYGDYSFTRSRVSELSVVGSDTGLLDTIKWTINVTDGEKTYANPLDNLHLINVAEGDERSFNFLTKNDIFTSTVDAGTTAAGKLTINGYSDGTTYSTINANSKNIFDLSAEGASVEIKNTKITNAGYVAQVANGNELILDNAYIDSSNTAGIANNGTLTLNHNNTINKDVTGTGTTVVDGITTLGADLTQANLQLKTNAELHNDNSVINIGHSVDGYADTGSKIVGSNGSFNLANGRFVNLGTIEQKFINITDGSLLGNAGSIKVSGSGQTSSDSVINGNGSFTNEGTFTNNGTISQGVITNSGTLTSDASKLIITNDTNKYITNRGTLNLTGGTIQADITGSLNDTNILGDVTFQNKISYNRLNIEENGILNLMTQAEFGTDAVLVFDGGTLSLQKQSSTNSFNLGNVSILKNTGLALDVDMAGSNAKKDADYIYMNNGLLVGTKEILINNIKLSNATDIMPAYAKVADGNLKSSVNIGDNTKTEVPYLPQDGFMITYAKDKDGDGGFLEFDYANLVTATRSDAEKKVYVIGSNGENIIQELENEGGTGITDDTYSFGGKSLSVNGNGSNSVVGNSTIGGTTVGNNQTYSLINIHEYKGFNKAITNNGTVNVTDVIFDNTTDIENNNQLNLYGTDVFNVITGNNGKTYIGTDPNDSTNYADVTIKSALTQNSVEVSGENNKLTVAGGATLTSALSNSGVVDNNGTMNVSGSSSKTIQGSGTMNLTGDFSNTGSLTQGTLGFNNGAVLTVGDSASVTGSNLVNDANKGTFNALNDAIQNFTLGNAKLASDLNYKLDLNQTALTADTLTISSVDSDSNGRIVISDIKFAVGDTYFATPIQVLKGSGSSSIELAIADGVEYIGNWDDRRDGEDIIDATTATVKWDDTYGRYHVIDRVTGKLQVVASDGGDTLKDSLGYVETSRVQGDKVYDDDFDTLALINQYETTLDRQFNFDTDEETQTYTAKANAGVTEFGKLTVNGISNDKSTIDFGDKTGFELTKTEEGKKSTVEIINTTVKGNSLIANVVEGNELILDNAVTQGAITNEGDLTLKNTNTLSGNVSGAGVAAVTSGTTTLDNGYTFEQGELSVQSGSTYVNNGTSTTAKLTNGSTVTNNSLFNVNGGTNSSVINGTNGTLKITDNFENTAAGSISDNIVLITNNKTFTNKGSIDLSGFENDENGGVLNSQNGAVQTMNLGNVKLNSRLSWLIDAELQGGAVTTSDNLTATSVTGTGSIVIDGINILSDSDIAVMKTLVADDTLKAYVSLATDASVYQETPTYNYAITYDDGYLKFSRAYNLVTVTRDTDSERVYNLTMDESVGDDIAEIGDASTFIGTMGGVNSKLTINGSGNSINGARNSGIKILEGQTLNINNVGKDSDGVVKGDGFYNFYGKDGNNVLSNHGTLNIVNSVFKKNKHQDTNAAYPYGSVIYNSETGVLSIKNSLFELNDNDGEGKGTVTNDGYAVITNSEFKNNYSHIYGGSVNNRANMIIGNGDSNAVTKFVDNNRASLYGYGGLENRGGKLLVNEKTEFTNNRGALSVDKLDYNGNTYRSTVLFDAESLFKDNINTAINTQDSKTYLTFAKKAEFDGNTGTDTGAIRLQTGSKVVLYDATFTNNSSTGTSDSDGGAIKNGGDLYLIAKNGDVEFTGNTANGVSRAVYNNGLMYLNAAEGKSIIFNDNITGASNKDIQVNRGGLEYRTLDGDLNEITSTIAEKGGNYIFNANVENANLKLYNNATITVGSTGGLNLYQLTSQNQGGTLDVLNNAIQNFTLGNVDLRTKDVNLEIDVNSADLLADTFTITGANNNTNANLLISDIKFADDESDFGLEKKIRVLNNSTGKAGIKLSDDLTAQYTDDNYQDIITGNHKIEAVTSGGVTTASVNYDEHYGEFSRTDVVQRQLQVTTYDDNSTVNDAIWWKELARTTGETIYEKDTLALINQSITDSEDVVKERSFNFTGTPTSEYTAISDAGVTAIGNFTINGVSSENSIINFNGKKGFEITDTTEKTTVTINDTTIKGASLVANVASGNELILNNSVIDSSNTGGITNAGTVNVISSAINQNISGDGTTNFSGTSSNTATINQNSVTNIGTLTNNGTISTITNNAGTIDNHATLTLAEVNAGTLNNKDGGTVGNLTLNDGEVFNSGDITTSAVDGGEFTNNADGEVTTLNQSAGIATNKGNIATVAQTGGTFTNEETNGEVTAFTQSGGTSSNYGLITTFTLDGGTASNSGTMTNAIVNQSTLTNNLAGQIVNLTNDSNVKNYGTVNGVLNNSGTISENGTITTADGVNSGTITQSSLTSTGVFANSGTITVDTFNHSGSDFTNDGTIAAGAFTNSGTMTNNDGNSITVTGTAQNTGSLTTNASDFVASSGLSNTGDLYLTGGETQNTISGPGGTTHIQGNVIISKTITDNIISLDPVSANLNGVARLGSTDISSAEKLLANGGDLNLQYQTGTEDYKLGNVDIQNATGLAINVDLTGSSEVKTADTISATSVSGSKKIYINNLNIKTPNDGDAAPEYAKVADNVLKGSVDLGDNTRAHVSSIPQSGFMITYAQDLAGANTGGFLELAYTDLVTASRATTKNRVYIMGQNDEDIVAQIDGNPAGSGYGGSGITDSAFPFGGEALSVNGNGTQSIVGGTLASGNTTGGFIIGNGQTLSLNNVKEVKGFTTGITNNGTTNITDVKFTNNTTDIVNNNTLNLYGTDEINTISGNDGTINVLSYNDDGNTVNANVKFVSGGSVVQKAVNIDENNTLNVNSSIFTVTDGITNDGTLNLDISANNNVISNTDAGKGTVNLNAAMTSNNADITANLITVNTGVSLVNANGKKLSANTVEVNSGLTTNASDVVILDDSSSIKNAGRIDFIGGKNENNVTIEGNGTNHFVNLTDVTGNTKSIEADSITNTLSSSTSSVVFNNEGTVNATDFIVNSGNWVNSGDGNVVAKSMVNYKNLVSNADKINITGNNPLDNSQGSFTITGGSNDNFKVSGGVVIIKTDNTAVNDTVNVVNNISANTFRIDKGTAQLASDDVLNYPGRDNGTVLATGGDASDTAILSYINDATSDIKWAKMEFEKDLNINIDADLSQLTADNFSIIPDEYTGQPATSVFNNDSQLLIDTIKLGALPTVKNTKVLVADENLSDHTNLSDAYSIINSYGNVITSIVARYVKDDTDSKGYLIFTSDEFKNLVTYVRDKDVSEYTLIGNEDIAADIAALGETDNKTSIGALKSGETSFTINGAGFSINGNGKAGITIADGQTLNINNVGDLTNTASTTNGLYGFDGTDGTYVLDNSGTLNLTSVVFGDNNIHDINNNNTLNLDGTNIISAVSGTGSTEVKGGTSTVDSLIQKSVTVSGGELRVGNVKTSDGIANNVEGGLNLTGGTIDSSVSGTSGTTVVSGDVIVKYLNSSDNTTVNTLAQVVTVEKTGSLNANVASIGADVTVNADNNDVGSITLYSQEANGGNLGYTVSGDGTTILNRNINVNADVTTKTINVATYLNNNTEYSANVVVADGSDFGTSGGTISVGSGNTLTMNNADNLAADTSNLGTLNLMSGTAENDITGAGGTTDIKGDVTLANTIKDNTISVESGAVANLMKSSNIEDAAKFIANGGDLNLQKENTTDAFNLGNVDLQSDMGLALDVSLEPDGETNKAADNISAASVTGDKKIYINNINITADSGDIIPAYAKVTDDNLKGSVDLGNASRVHVDNLSPVQGQFDSFMVTYVTDTDDDKLTTAGGYLKFEYSDLANAVKSTTSTKSYVMTKDENVTENLNPLNGDSLSVSGNGNKIIGQGSTGGISPVGEGQTLSIFDVSEMSGFKTAITNTSGTVNLENVVMTGNETDINNNAALNLFGTDEFDTVIGTGSTTIGDGTKTGDVTVNNKLEQKDVTLTTSNDKLTLKGTSSVENVTNDGTIDNQGSLSITNSLDNENGTISNTVSGAELNLTGEDMTIAGIINNTNGADINIDGSGTATLSATTTNDGNLNVKSNTDVTGPVKGTGTMTNTSDLLSIQDLVEQSEFINESGNTEVDDTKGSITVSGDIVNDGTLTSRADNLTAGGEIKNNNTLNLTGGENKNTITGNNGTTNFSGTSTNSADITQKLVTNSGDLTNNANINADVSNKSNGSFANDGSIFGKVDNSGTFTNNGSIGGDITNNKSGDFTNNSKLSVNVNNAGKFTNNDIISGKFINSGKVDNVNGSLTGTVDNKKSGDITTKIAGLSGKVKNNGTINYVDGGSTIIDIKGNGLINLDGDDTVTLNNDIDGNTLSLNSGNLVFGSNKDISKGGFIANGGNIKDVLDGKITTYKLGNAKVNKNTGIDGIDFDLSNLTSDKFIGDFSGKGKLVIDKVRIQGNTLESHIRVSLSDTTNIANNNLEVKSQDLPEILTPIMWLKGSIEDNYLVYQGRGGGYNDFNPAIMASSVAAHVGGYNAQMEAFEHGFYHMNRYTKYSASDRLSAENYNKVAISDTLTVNPKVENPLTEEAIWTKPYTSWESVHLKHGPHVNSFSYGHFFGGDTDLVDIGRGFKGVLSAFIGYNGNHMSYNDISMDMQGGTLGVTGTAYKGNFFTGLTASTGASGVEAYTQYGTDHFGMINAGVASKTGYNWEIKGGRLIVQPTLLLGYTFVNTFDYTNAAGVKIESDPYSSLQIAPELKVIANTESGWQPYAKVGLMYNIALGNRTVNANDVKLPQLSNRPYVQYGVGIQRSWSDRFTAFFETLLRGGGRNGVMLFAGFRWTLGKDKNKQNQVKPVKTIIKSNDTIRVPEGDGLEPLSNITRQSAVNKVDNSTVTAVSEKTVIKRVKPKKKSFLWF